MIAPLRRCHRIVVPLLGVVAISLLFLALLNRRPIRAQAVDQALSRRVDPADFPVTLGPLFFSGQEHTVAAVLIADAAPPSRLALDIAIQSPLRSPAPLLYWMPADDFQQSVLIGSFPTTGRSVIELGPELKNLSGSLVIYSLGHQEELARAALSEVDP